MSYPRNAQKREGLAAANTQSAYSIYRLERRLLTHPTQGGFERVGRREVPEVRDVLREQNAALSVALTPFLATSSSLFRCEHFSSL